MTQALSRDKVVILVAYHVLWLQSAHLFQSPWLTFRHEGFRYLRSSFPDRPFAGCFKVRFLCLRNQPMIWKRELRDRLENQGHLQLSSRQSQRTRCVWKFLVNTKRSSLSISCFNYTWDVKFTFVEVYKPHKFSRFLLLYIPLTSLFLSKSRLKVS